MTKLNDDYKYNSPKSEQDYSDLFAQQGADDEGDMDVFISEQVESKLEEYKSKIRITYPEYYFRNSSYRIRAENNTIVVNEGAEDLPDNKLVIDCRRLLFCKPYTFHTIVIKASDVFYLEVDACPNLTKIIFPSSLQSLIVENCPKLASLQCTDLVSELSLLDVDFTNLSRFEFNTDSLESLSVVGCDNIKELPHLPKLKYLWCSVPFLGNNNPDNISISYRYLK